MRPTARLLAHALLLALVLAAQTRGAAATIQEDSCLEPDVEYPVPCDDED